MIADSVHAQRCASGTTAIAVKYPGTTSTSGDQATCLVVSSKLFGPPEAVLAADRARGVAVYG